VHPGDQALDLQFGEIAPYGLLGDLQLRGQVENADPPGLSGELDNPLAPLQCVNENLQPFVPADNFTASGGSATWNGTIFGQ